MAGFADIALMEDIELCRCLRRVSAPLCLDMPVTTSSRRWEQAGVYRTIWLMWSLRLRYFLGADPARLVARYYQVALTPATVLQFEAVPGSVSKQLGNKQVTQRAAPK